MKKTNKVVSSASVHMYTAHSTKTLSVCVGRGMRGNRVKERGTDTETQISTEGGKETERRKRQAAWRMEYCVMLSGERKITLQRREHKGSTTSGAAQQKMLGASMFGKETYSSSAQSTRGGN